MRAPEWIHAVFWNMTKSHMRALWIMAVQNIRGGIGVEDEGLAVQFEVHVERGGASDSSHGTMVFYFTSSGKSLR